MSNTDNTSTTMKQSNVTKQSVGVVGDSNNNNNNTNDSKLDKVPIAMRGLGQFVLDKLAAGTLDLTHESKTETK